VPWGVGAELLARSKQYPRELRFAGHVRQPIGTGDPGIPLPVTDTTPIPAGTNNIGTVNAQGDTASGATDGGNPVKIGGVFNSTLPSLSAGQRGNGQLDSVGRFLVSIGGIANVSSDGASSVFVYANQGSGNDASGGRVLAVANHVWNGASEDRFFTCPNTALINVTAASTTQIVALGASQIIRVCSFSISMSAAGTAQFVYGTGTNCATGLTSITPAMPLLASTPWTMTGMNGSVFRTIASNELCVAAVTGNAVGFVTYAQY
jgi:hypothetical protein